MTDENEFIDAEVQRRVGRQTRRFHEEIADLRDINKELTARLIERHEKLKRLLNEPLCFGTLLKVHPYVDPQIFKANDKVIVVREDSPYFQQGGKIISGLNETPVVDDEGTVLVKLHNEEEVCFSIGVEGKDPAEIRLSEKEDGTYAVVSIDGKAWEVSGLGDLQLQVGEPVKVKPDTKAIVSRGYDLHAGPICHVVAITEGGSVEIEHKGEKHLINNPRGFDLEEGDRVACDPTMFCVMEKLKRDNRDRYKLTTDLNTTWGDVGGLEVAKQQIQDALELPFLEPDLFNYYKVQPLRGILLYGPPGCGKTLLARVMAWAIAQAHGKEAIESGYIFVKSPEILSKWVGNTESEIRELFQRARRHYYECGYKALLAFDEADAIMPQRGTRRSSDISDTIVPMFLGEMDGVNPSDTEANPIVVLMSNRADILDPAITRPGRISKHIKIDRPTDNESIDILGIHTKDIPFVDKDKTATLAVAVSDLFSKSRLLYRVNNEHDFTLGDAVNGAMLASLAEEAKMLALHRDLSKKIRTGVTVDDFRKAVDRVASQQRGINHSYDLQDFAEKHGIQPQNMNIERCFGSA